MPNIVIVRLVNNASSVRKNNLNAVLCLRFIVLLDLFQSVHCGNAISLKTLTSGEQETKLLRKKRGNHSRNNSVSRRIYYHKSVRTAITVIFFHLMICMSPGVRLAGRNVTFHLSYFHVMNVQSIEFIQN